MSSSPTQIPPDDRTERRKSIGKYVKRLSTVLRRGSSTKDVPKATTTSEPVPKPAAISAAPESKPAPSGATTHMRSTIQQERARALFEKYGLTLEAHEWITSPTAPTNVQRVEKPIRMRVHRTCHRCQATFGPDKICSKCEHKRCKKCPRYPAKKRKDAAVEGKGKQAAGAAAVTTTEAAKKTKKREPYLTIKSKTGGDLIYHPPKQRIHRTCHKCQTEFIPPTATECQNCKHTRCTKCPRDPAKLKKWPKGYPGDAPAEEPQRPQRTWRKPRQRVRWTCDQCSSLFKEGLKTCSNCNHERCDNCMRQPRKKVKKEHDPEVVKAVEEKLARLTMRDSQPSASAA